MCIQTEPSKFPQTIQGYFSQSSNLYCYRQYARAIFNVLKVFQGAKVNKVLWMKTCGHSVNFSGVARWMAISINRLLLISKGHNCKYVRASLSPTSFCKCNLSFRISFIGLSEKVYLVGLYFPFSFNT